MFPAFIDAGYKRTRPPSPPGFWRVHGLTRSTHAEIRYLHTWKSVNLAWAVRISGDGGQEGRHLAKKKKGYGARQENMDAFMESLGVPKLTRTIALKNGQTQRLWQGRPPQSSRRTRT